MAIERGLKMEKTNKKLNAKQTRALACLLAGLSVPAAAEAAGCSYQSIYNWLDKPEFRAALNQAQSEAIIRLSRVLINLGTDAADVLGEVIRDKNMPPAVRVRAADIVISNLLSLRENIEFDGRLSELEAAILNQRGERKPEKINYGVRAVDYRDAIRNLAPEDN